MTDAHRILNALLRTEKGGMLVTSNKYLFSVALKANKSEIKRAVEAVYKVKVAGVNTQVSPGKLKRVRTKAGYTADWKKAVVTLKEGQQIDLA